MSNKHEIEEELKVAESRLTILCRREHTASLTDDKSATVRPTCGDEMRSLREECSQLRIVLEAMEASED